MSMMLKVAIQTFMLVIENLEDVYNLIPSVAVDFGYHQQAW